jgi:uncharacterized protein
VVVPDEPTRRRAFDALIDKVGPGRSRDTRPPTGKELAATAVLAVPLVEVSVKVRAAGVNEEPADHGLPYWAGIIPVRTLRGVPEPDAGVDRPVPDYLREHRSAWWEPVVLRGKHVVLEPLDACHAAELFHALDDEEVHRYIPAPRPTSAAEMARAIAARLAEHAAGLRVPWVLRAASGEIAGTTSYCPADETNRTVHIGSTQLGRAWWRTGVNTEAKLLLMTRAFEELGAVRVEWQVDNLNVRSQRAVERLGATREGVLRKHRRRADGTFRDSVFYGLTDDEWPAAKKALVERLARG